MLLDEMGFEVGDLVKFRFVFFNDATMIYLGRHADGDFIFWFTDEQRLMYMSPSRSEFKIVARVRDVHA